MKHYLKYGAAVLLLITLLPLQARAKDGSALPAEGYPSTLNALTATPYLSPDWLGKKVVLKQNDLTFEIKLSDLAGEPVLLFNNGGTAALQFTDPAVMKKTVASINEQLVLIPTAGTETVYDRASGLLVPASTGMVCQLRREFPDLLLQTLQAQLSSDLAPDDIVIDLNAGYLVAFPAGGANVLAGSCTTSLSGSSSNRISNVQVASSHLNNMVIMPGEEISVSDSILPRTTANGYKEAGTYLNGEVVPGLGGGICQVSSTIYNAAMNSGLTVVERHPHSMPVHYLPLGLDAAISAGSKDLRIRNDYDLPVYIQAGVEGKSLTISVILNEALLNGQTYKMWSKVPGHNVANTYLSTYDAAGNETSRVSVGTSRYSDPKPKQQELEED